MEEKVRWTIQASENLEEIFDFLERTSSSEYASKVIQNIYKKTEILNQYPKIGQIEFRLINRKFEYRYLIFSHYKVIYFLDGDIAIIAMVFDCRKHPLKLRIE